MEQKLRLGALALIIKDNKIIMGKKAHRPGHFLSDAWHFPGGKAEEGETPEQTIVREMKEELSMNVKIIKKLCDYELTINGVTGTNAVFICESDDEPIANDDIVDARYFTVNEVREIHNHATFEKLPQEVKDYIDSLE